MRTTTLIVVSILALAGSAWTLRTVHLGVRSAQASTPTIPPAVGELSHCDDVYDGAFVSPVLSADENLLCQDLEGTRQELAITDLNDDDARWPLVQHLLDLQDRLGLGDNDTFYDQALKEARLQCIGWHAIATGPQMSNSRDPGAAAFESMYCQPAGTPGQYQHRLYYRCMQCQVDALHVTAAPSIASCGVAREASGVMDVTCIGTPDVSYEIEAASSIVQPLWSVIGTATADSTGKITFVDQDAPSQNIRFYRAVPVSQ